MNQNNITNQYKDVIDEYNVLEVINQKKIKLFKHLMC